jgi:tetratricopeptide (TPR) repeat protein
LALALSAAMPVAAGLLRDGDSSRNLDPIPVPDTSRLSEAVRVSLTAVEAEFDRRAPQLDDLQLGVAYGRLAMRYQSHQLDGATGPAYRNAIRLDPSEFRWQYYLGFMYQEIGDFVAASASYDRARDLAPDYAPAELRAALAALDAERTQDAKRRLLRYLEDNAEEAAALAALGEIAALESDHQTAVGYFQRALEIAPYADQLYYPLALSLRRIGSIDAATSAMARRGEQAPVFTDPELSAMQALSRSPAFFVQRGQEALAAERTDEALSMFLAAVEIHPDSIPSRSALARMLVAMQEFTAAREHLQHVIALDGSNVRALAGLGRIAEFEADDTAALSFYQSWVDAGGGAQAWFRLGDAALRVADYERARDAYQAAISASERPTPQLVSRLAIASLAVGDCEAALALLEQQRAPEPLMWRSRALATCPARSVDERRAALAMAQALADRYPNEATSVTLALALAGSGDTAAATGLVRQILFESLRSGTPAAETTLLQEALASFEAEQPMDHAMTADGPFLSPQRAEP